MHATGFSRQNRTDKPTAHRGNRCSLTKGDRGLAVPAIVKASLDRHPALSTEEEKAVATAAWLAREDAWDLVLADSLASARAAALLLALERSEEGDKSLSEATIADRRLLLSAISTGDSATIARADKDDEVLRQVVNRLPVALAAKARACLMRLDAAIRKIERHNVGLVLYVIRCKFRGVVAGDDGRGSGADFEVGDLLGYGTLGLRTAALRFDVAKGWKFSTYATWWIVHAIRRGMQDARYRVRLPVHMQDALSKISKATAALKDAGQAVTDDAIAERTGVAAKKVRTVLDAWAMNSGPSLDSRGKQTDGEDMAREFGDSIPDPGAESEEDLTDSLDEQARKAVLYDALGALSDRDRFIVEMRAGIGGDESQANLSDLGGVLGLSRERVRQLEGKALRQLRAEVEDRMDVC